MGHFAFDLNDVFTAKRTGEFLSLAAALRPETDLRLAVAIANVNEQHATVIAVGVDPTANRYFLSDVFRSKFTASMGPKQRISPLSIKFSYRRPRKSNQREHQRRDATPPATVPKNTDPVL